MKSRDFAIRLRGPPGQPSSRHAGGAVADKQLTRKTRNLGYENRVKVIKHDFQNPLSCKEDNEGLTKTLREDKETSVRQPGPLKTTMLVQTKMHKCRSTGDGRSVSICIVLTDGF